MKPKILSLISLIILSGCAKEKALKFTLTDEELFEQILTVNKNYYKSGAVQNAQGTSPHGNFKLWVNDIGQSVLDSQNELPINKTFPDKSLIVKEITNGTTISLYAVMYKSKNFWQWAEFESDGTVYYSVKNAGSSCINCHSGSGNRDQTLTYFYH